VVKKQYTVMLYSEHHSTQTFSWSPLVTPRIFFIYFILFIVNGKGRSL